MGQVGSWRDILETMAQRSKLNTRRVSKQVKEAAKELKAQMRARRNRQPQTGPPASRIVTQAAQHIDDRERVWQLKVQGLTFQQIGAVLGCTGKHAWELFYEAGGERIVRQRDQAATLREVENEKMDEVHRAMLPLAHGRVPNKTVMTGRGKRRRVQVIQPDPIEVARVQTQAVARIVQISGRRAALNGLDAPLKITPTDPTGERRYNDLSEEELERHVSELRAALGLPSALPTGSNGSGSSGGNK